MTKEFEEKLQAATAEHRSHEEDYLKNIQSLTEQLNQATANSSALQKRVQEREEEVRAELDEQINEMKSSLERTKVDAQRAHTFMRSALSDKQNALVRSAELEELLQQEKDKALSAQRTVSTLEEKLRLKENDLESKEKALKELEALMSKSAEGGLLKVKEELDIERSRSKELASQITEANQSLEANKTDYQRQLDKLSETLAECQVELHQASTKLTSSQEKRKMLKEELLKLQNQEKNQLLEQKIQELQTVSRVCFFAKHLLA